MIRYKMHSLEIQGKGSRQPCEPQSRSPFHSEENDLCPYWKMTEEVRPITTHFAHLLPLVWE